jgi:corrinoid protein of di/trimethylamine methyltransferase
MSDFLAQCKEAVLKGDRDRAVQLARNAAEGDHDVIDVIEKGFSQGIREAGELWEKGEFFLPELAFSAESMTAALDILRPALLSGGTDDRSKGLAIIGTVQGDIHDIGKTLVATMLSANGYTVIDLGSDVPYDRFIEETKVQKPDILCMSALLTTTMVGQKEVIDRLVAEGLRDRVKVLVGGAPTTDAWATQIGADAHAGNAVEAVQTAATLLS